MSSAARAVAPALLLALVGITAMMLRDGVPLWRWRRMAAVHTAAAAGLADLAGRNSVAVGADTVVDLLVRTAPLLAVGDSPTPLRTLALWRLALSETTCREAGYLGVVLTRWQRRRNSISPDLARDVDLRCLDGVGTAVISPQQAHELELTLDRLDLRGTVPVRGGEDSQEAGRDRTFMVGPHAVVLAAEPAPVMPRPAAGRVAGWLEDRQRRRHRAAVERAFRRGREEVILVSESAAREVSSAYLELRGQLDPSLEAEVGRRLAETYERLAALRAS